MPGPASDSGPGTLETSSKESESESEPSCSAGISASESESELCIDGISPSESASSHKKSTSSTESTGASACVLRRALLTARPLLRAPRREGFSSIGTLFWGVLVSGGRFSLLGRLSGVATCCVTFFTSSRVGNFLCFLKYSIAKCNCSFRSSAI